jgi:hypothetical protein
MRRQADPPSKQRQTSKERTVEIEELFGLPAHPLVVHGAVVLVPLAGAGALLCLSPRIRRHLGVAVLVIAILGTIATGLAQGSGEELEEQVDETELVEEHASMGDTLLPWVIVLDLALGGLLALDLRRRRSGAGADDAAPVDTPGWVGPAAIALSAIIALSAVGGTIRVIQIGHSGAKATWDEEVEGGERDGGGEHEDGEEPDDD